MMLKRKIVFLLCCFPYILHARLVDTFYGPIEVQEDILIELIDHPAFQRLKQIHQYGVAYYTSYKEPYTRYDHSIGVFAILRAKNASIEAQIAGLLHDVSHTAFSHVGDWVFDKKDLETDYQSSVHGLFLQKSGLGDVLKKFHFTIDQVLPTEDLFPALERTLPNLCADRIDYNIQGAYHRGFITYQEAISIFNDLQFINNQWICQKPDLMTKIARFSIYMSQNCWGSALNHILSQWLANAIIRAVEIDLISYDDFTCGTDQEIWDLLLCQQDPIIKKNMEMILNPHAYFSIVDTADQADIIIQSKFRGIDPWILSESGCRHLTEIDPQFCQEYEKTKQMMGQGWMMQIKSLNLRL